jgi:hypothetical protein
MKTITFVILAATIVASPVWAHAAEYYVTGWPPGIFELPCDAWKHNDDGSWTLVATVHFDNMTY